eukprot:SAG22_NODE_1135_length_5398_cov_3.581808_3_plen_1167_part_00
MWGYQEADDAPAAAAPPQAKQTTAAILREHQQRANSAQAASDSSTAAATAEKAVARSFLQFLHRLEQDGGGQHLAYGLRLSAEHVSAAFCVRLEDDTVAPPGAELLTIFDAGVRALPAARAQLNGVFDQAVAEQREQAATVLRRLTERRAKLEQRALAGSGGHYQRQRARVQADAVARQQAAADGVARLRALLDVRAAELAAAVAAAEAEYLAAIDERQQADDRTIALALELEAATASLLAQPDQAAFSLGYADLQPGIRRVLADAASQPAVPAAFGCELDVDRVAAVLEGQLRFADQSAAAQILVLQAAPNAATACRALRAHPQPSLAVLKAGCQRLHELAATNQPAAAVAAAAGTETDAEGGGGGAVGGADEGGSSGMADAVEWLLELLDEPTAAKGSGGGSGAGGYRSRQDCGLVCLALRALAAAVGHRTASDDRPEPLLEFVDNRGLQRVLMLLLLPSTSADTGAENDREIQQMVAAGCRMLRAVYLQLHLWQHGTGVPLVSPWSAEDAASDLASGHRRDGGGGGGGGGGGSSSGFSAGSAADAWARIRRQLHAAEPMVHLLPLLGATTAESTRLAAAEAVAAAAAADEHALRAAAATDPAALAVAMTVLTRMLRAREPQHQLAGLEAAAALTHAPGCRAALAAAGGGVPLATLAVQPEPQMGGLAAIALMNCCRGDDSVARRLASTHGLFPALVGRLQDFASSPDAVAAVAGLLRVLCQSGKGRSAETAGECARQLTAAGALPALIGALHSSSLAVQAAAAFAIFVLTQLDGNKVAIGAAAAAAGSGSGGGGGGGIQRLVELLAAPSPVVQLYAAWALINVSIVEDNKAKIGEQTAAISLLTMLLTHPQPRLQAAAAHALLNLAVNRRNKAAIAGAGAIGTLVELVGGGGSGGGGSESVDKFAVGALSLLIQEDKPNKGRLAAAGGVAKLVELLGARGGSRGVRRNAAGAVLNYCYGASGVAEAEAVCAAGGVRALLGPPLSRSDHADPELLRFTCWALELLASQHAGSVAVKAAFMEALHLVHRLEAVVTEQPALEAAKFAAGALKHIRRFAGADADFGNAASDRAEAEPESAGRSGAWLGRRIAKAVAGGGGGGGTGGEDSVDRELTTSLFSNDERRQSSAEGGWSSRYNAAGRAMVAASSGGDDAEPSPRRGMVGADE